MNEFYIVIIGIMCMIGSMIVIGALFLGPLSIYEHGRAQTIQKCNDMNLGDNSTEGYMMKLQEKCFNL